MDNSELVNVLKGLEKLAHDVADGSEEIDERLRLADAFEKGAVVEEKRSASSSETD